MHHLHVRWDNNQTRRRRWAGASRRIDEWLATLFSKNLSAENGVHVRKNTDPSRIGGEIVSVLECNSSSRVLRTAFCVSSFTLEAIGNHKVPTPSTFYGTVSKENADVGVGSLPETGLLSRTAPSTPVMSASAFSIVDTQSLALSYFVVVTGNCQTVCEVELGHSVIVNGS